MRPTAPPPLPPCKSAAGGGVRVHSSGLRHPGGVSPARAPAHGSRQSDGMAAATGHTTRAQAMAQAPTWKKYAIM